MRQRARMVNLTICYCKKKIDVSFLRVYPIIDNEFHHNFAKVLRKFMISNRTDTRKTDGNLLNPCI